jgi:hypothetical protein
MKYPKERKSRTGDVGTIEERKKYYESCLKCEYCTYRTDKIGKRIGKDGWKSGLKKAFRNKKELLQHYNNEHPEKAHEIYYLFEDDELVQCPICNKKMRQITDRHLLVHGINTTKEFLEKYPNTMMRPNSLKKKWSKHAYKINNDPKVGEKISKSLREGHQKGKYKYRDQGKIRGYFYSKKNNKIFPYRSSYEYLAFNILEKDGSVNSYEYESLRIRYKGEDNKKHTYYPDILTNNNRIIEVKAEWALINEEKAKINFIKIKAAERFAEKNGYTFEIWTEFELNEKLEKLELDKELLLEKINI